MSMFRQPIGNKMCRSKNLLTKRQLEVLILLSMGLTNREIAERLTIKESTVERHVHNIFGRIGATSRAQAAVWAVLNGLLDDQPEDGGNLT